jgi:hypothetical protein
MSKLLGRLTALLAGLAVLASSSCAFFRSNRNEPIDAALLERLVVGRTTAREAVEILGGPSQVVQLGNRSAYRYDHTTTKGTGLLLLVLNFGHADTREDRVWLFFDETDLLTHVGHSLEAHRAQYAFPWEDIHEASEREAADAERGVRPRSSGEPGK